MATALDKVRQLVEDCKACPLHRDRKQTVFDRGNPDAPLMIVGEAPGQEEDACGQAFVGKAGRLLSKLLNAARVPEDQVYLANVLKCRPANNRFPEGDPPEKCRQYLLKQVQLVQPKAVLLCGKQALSYLLIHGTHEDPNPIFPWINKQYRRRDVFGDIRFLVCYHPSYLLRTGIEEDQEAWIQSVASLWA